MIKWPTCSKALETLGGDRDKLLTGTSTVIGAILLTGSPVSPVTGVTLLTSVTLFVLSTVAVVADTTGGFCTTMTFRRIPPPSLSIIRPPEQKYHHYSVVFTALMGPFLLVTGYFYTVVRVITNLAKWNYPSFPDLLNSHFQRIIKRKPNVTNYLSSNFGSFVAEVQNILFRDVKR